MATEMFIRVAVCTAALFLWQSRGASADFSTRAFWGISRVSASLLRVYPDYLILITTREHLSTELSGMLFGRRRAETDRTRYYDFASVAYHKNITLKRFGGLEEWAGVKYFLR